MSSNHIKTRFGNKTRGSLSKILKRRQLCFRRLTYVEKVRTYIIRLRVKQRRGYSVEMAKDDCARRGIARKAEGRVVLKFEKKSDRNSLETFGSVAGNVLKTTETIRKKKRYRNCRENVFESIIRESATSWKHVDSWNYYSENAVFTTQVARRT